MRSTVNNNEQSTQFYRLLFCASLIIVDRGGIILLLSRVLGASGESHSHSENATVKVICVATSFQSLFLIHDLPRNQTTAYIPQ
jgi:hypothetical protein